ncbi:FprA family A-type flavoprotein [Methanocaldococcus indicus]|uniref:FprA family A-type flavoprotein n=1 Tax=Methanocaldococcus indicus TaxID=213231 RepID=UPI003C6D14DD
MIRKIKENIYFVGAIDWDVRNFHGYNTDNGTTYNSYLILDEKITLIDTVKDHKADELINNIKKLVNPNDIDYIVINHVEKDHSGALPELMKITNAKIVTNDKGKEHLEEHYNTEGWEFLVVDDEEELNIGKRTLKFFKTPMLHWPENMVTYLIEDKILFSNDAFGQHYASSQRFDYEVRGDIFLYAREYFANILMPYKFLINNVIEKLTKLEIEYIAPSHGIIWNKYIDDIIKYYIDWASGKVSNKAVIVYDTMYNSTKKMAYAIADGLIEEGVNVKIYNLTETPVSKIISEILTAKYLLVGSPTLNKNLYPEVAKFLAYMEGLNPTGKIAVAFGSYGWYEVATEKIKEVFKRLNYKIVDDDCLKVKFSPKEEDLNKLYEFGKNLAKIE